MLLNKKNAIAHFKSTGEWFEGCVMHHKDPSLKQNNPDRYNLWLPEDLVCLSRSDHYKIHNLGAKRSDEWRKNLSNGQKGKVYSQETKDKLSEALTGIKRSEETRQKISLAKKEYWAKRKEQNAITVSD